MSDIEASFFRCKLVLEEFLREGDVPLSSKHCVDWIEGAIANYLGSNGYSEFLDLSGQVGGVSDAVLSEFANQGKIFEGKSGRFRIKAQYGPMSVRYFEAWLVE